MSGIMLQVDASGKISEYKQPYTTIECATEEDFKRLEYLLNLGRATEKAFKKEAPELTFEPITKICIRSPKELLDWAKKEE